SPLHTPPLFPYTTLFRSSDARTIGESIAILSNRFTELLPILVPILNDLPTPASLRVKRAIARLDEVIHRMIRQHQRNGGSGDLRSEEHTSELQSLAYLVC